jgi:hypothetical protein
MMLRKSAGQYPNYWMPAGVSTTPEPSTFANGSVRSSGDGIID